MHERKKLFRRQERGGVIIGALFFTLVISILLMGVSWFAVSHQQRAQYDSRYAAALDLAEAGVNYEFRKISNNVAQADTTPLTQNTPFQLPGTAFTVQCVNRGTTTPWSGPGTDLDVLSTGTASGVSRIVRCSGKAFTWQADFAVFGIHSVALGGSANVYGDVGTDGTLSGSQSEISGNVYLYGPGASWSGGTASASYPNALSWPTVDQKALALFPNSGSTVPGGMAYLATNNDNAKAGLPTSGATLSGGETLVGPGNYYVTGINMTGNRSITFDNANGDINIWVGPDGGAGSVTLKGCTAAGSTDITQSGHQVNIFVATTGGVDMRGTSAIYANIYAYNTDSAGNPYGSVTNHGTPDVYGSVLGYDVTLQGNPGVHYIPTNIEPVITNFFGFDTSWTEVNPRRAAW